MNRPWKLGAAALAIILTFTTVGGCGSQGGQMQGGSGGAQETDAKAEYNETKSMVLDILHTKEGMDALKDIVRDPTFKHSLALNETDVQIAMQKALTDGTNHVTLMEQMKNPKFATVLAKSFKNDHEKIIKNLMKDPEYQEMVLTLLKSPDYQRMLYDLMKTPEYRKQTMTIMTQALQNPEFRLVFMELIQESIKAGVTERTPNEKKKMGQLEEGGGEEGKKKEEGGEEGGKKKEEGGGGEEAGAEGGEKKKKEEDGGGEEGGGESGSEGGGEGGEGGK